MIKWIYQDGGKSRTGEGAKYPSPTQGTMWVFAVGPSENELAKISKDFSLPMRVLKNYTRERRSVRYSFEPFACTFVDYQLLHGEIERTNVLFFITKNFLITILEEPIVAYETAFSEISGKIGKEKFSAVEMLTQVLDADVEENYDVLEAIENDIMELQKEIAIKRARTHIEKVVELRRTLNHISRAFWGSSRITYFLKIGLVSLKPTQIEMRKIDDLHEGFIHQLDMISNMKETLTDTITIYQTNISNWLATISNRINSSIKLLTWIMLVLTGLTLVLTVPNTLATIFGIPYFGLSPGVSEYIVELLIASTIVPAVLFFYYWKIIRKKAQEVESQNV